MDEMTTRFWGELSGVGLVLAIIALIALLVLLVLFLLMPLFIYQIRSDLRALRSELTQALDAQIKLMHSMRQQQTPQQSLFNLDGKKVGYIAPTASDRAEA